MATPPLRIPKTAQPTLRLLASMNEQSFNELTAALAKMTGSLDHTVVASRIASQVQSLESANTRAIVETLLSMYVVRDKLGMDIADFASGIRRSMEASTDLADLTSTERDRVEDRLRKLMAFDEGIGLSSKALDLSTEYENLFVRCRILTDLRPVFGLDLPHGPSGAVISHTLKIECHQAKGEHDYFFVTMHTSDLEELREQLDRAVQKETALRGMLGGTQVRLFSDDAEEVG